MSEIKSMTDAELVEAVAREVLGWNIVETAKTYVRYTMDGSLRWFGIYYDPIHNMNDLFMVLDKFEEWEISKDLAPDSYIAAARKDNHRVSRTARILPRAVLEACLSAERGKG